VTQTQQSRRPAANGTTANNQLNTYTRGQSNPTASALPIARVHVLPPGGRRTMEAAVVSSCPWCGDRGRHLHRGFGLNGAVRRSGCAPHREYVLAVVA
jgi:hypothetical protein